MTDEEMIAQALSLPHLYFDGYVAYRKMNGVLRCIAHIDGVPQYNIITSVVGADLANRATRLALDAKPTRAIAIWAGKSLPH
jgi:hypothetical protein